jgi:hypothetical protein
LLYLHQQDRGRSLRLVHENSDAPGPPNRPAERVGPNHKRVRDVHWQHQAEDRHREVFDTFMYNHVFLMLDALGGPRQKCEGCLAS